jgi:hypothetical protein
MAGLVPAIHVFLPSTKTWKPGHDEVGVDARLPYTLKIVSPSISNTRKITTKT